MEYAIAIFIGIWIAGAGVLSYIRFCKDFEDVSIVSDKEKGDKK